MKNDNLIGVVILIVLIVVVIAMPKGPQNSSSNSNSYIPGKSVTPITLESSYTKDISISTGNAAYAYQPYEEYITIYNRSRNPIDITNWQLRNAKDERAYDIGGSLRYFAEDRATIGQATLILSPTGNNFFQDVVLGAGETAIVTTGKIGSQVPYKIVSFKENMCSGYLEDLPEYAFTPTLNRNCPRPADEPGLEAQDSECRKYIERMQSCHTPKFDTRDKDGDICTNCVDGKPLSNSCVAFIKNHFNYGSCIAYHAGDAKFSGQTWRVFLGQSGEMWAKDYETIKLFDLLGKLVTSRSY